LNHETGLDFCTEKQFENLNKDLYLQTPRGIITIPDGLFRGITLRELTMRTRFTAGMMIAAMLMCATALADESQEAAPYDRIWGVFELFDDDDATVLQNLSLVGRLQGDAVSFHSEDGNYDDFDWRRFRFGVKATVFNDFILHAEMDADMNDVDEDSWDAFYGRITDAYIGWSASPAAKIKVGKQSAGFTLDGATSSKKLLVPERSIVAENLWFTTEYFTGAALSGKVEGWSYNLGGFSASKENEFGHFESGYFALLSAGHTLGDQGSLRLDYVYNNPDYTGIAKDPDYTVGSKDLEHMVALVYKQMIGENLGLWADVAGGAGITDSAAGVDQSDLLGVDIMPFYNISDRLQLVLQYAVVTSLDNEPQVSMSRYASKNADKEKVETSHNVLLGFNWYLYGHKLKWQNAVEYNYGRNPASTGTDYRGYGLTSALRISW
jgi:phosphate-selective porin OprO/OprP